MVHVEHMALKEQENQLAYDHVHVGYHGVSVKTSVGEWEQGNVKRLP